MGAKRRFIAGTFIPTQVDDDVQSPRSLGRPDNRRRGRDCIPARASFGLLDLADVVLNERAARSMGS